MRAKIEKIKGFMDKHSEYFLPASLLVGFIFDFITLNRADQIYDNIVLFGYVLLTGLTVFIRYSKPNALTLQSFIIKNKEFIPYLMQFSFGGLFSALLAFYSKSGTIVTSFPFILLLAGIMIGNEFFLKKYQKLTLHFVLFYIALLSYTTFIFPVLTKRIGTSIFIMGAVIGLVFIILFLKLILKNLPTDLQKHKTTLKRSVPVVFSIFVIFYFLNVIPPIPLALKSGGIYYSVQRVSTSTYVAEREVIPWYKPFSSYNTDMASGREIYAFSAVFAPTKLIGTIYHQWSYFDENKNRWVETDRIPITITGGRDEGFRGLSSKKVLTDGLWRVDVETKSGQVIGRLKFNIRDKEVGQIISERF